MTQVIQQELILLQFSKEDEPGPFGDITGAVAAEQFVALDNASGGYPYPTSINRAYNFRSVEGAKAFCGHFEGLAIRKVKVTYEVEDVTL